MSHVISDRSTPEEANGNLPVLAEPSRALEARWSAPPHDPSWTPRAADPFGSPWAGRGEDPVLPLNHYLWILKRHRWKILSFVLAGMIASLVVSLRLQPLYESISTIDIDRQMPTGVIGQESMRSPINDADQFLSTQIRLIQSDAVLRPVAQKYKLLEVERDSGSPGGRPLRPPQHHGRLSRRRLHRAQGRRQIGRAHV